MSENDLEGGLGVCDTLSCPGSMDRLFAALILIITAQIILFYDADSLRRFYGISFHINVNKFNIFLLCRINSSCKLFLSMYFYYIYNAFIC